MSARTPGAHPVIALALALAASGVLTLASWCAVAVAATVEPGSQGNLLVLHVTNTDAQLPLMPIFRYRHVPAWVTRAVPDGQTTVPNRLVPGASGDASFVFDVAVGASAGASDSVVITLERNPDDTTTVSLPLTVVAPTPLPHGVRVVLRADFATGYLPPGGGAVAALLDGASTVPLHDDGVAPDVAPGDRLYSGERLFAPGEPARHRYAITLDGVSECDSLLSGDRRLFVVDPYFDATSNPQILPPGAFGVCATTAVGGSEAWIPFAMHTAPNPFASFTRIAFHLPRSGRAVLAFYDIAGRRVRAMPLGLILQGQQVATWDGRDDQGRPLRAGAYLCSLALEGELVGARRLVIVR